MFRKTNISLFYIFSWGIGSFISFIAQLIFPTWLAEQSTWGYARGWQNEIAFWNLGILAIILVTLYKKDVKTSSVITLGLIVFSLFFGGNHLIALLSNYSKVVHWFGFAANFLGVILGIGTLALQKK